MRFKILSLVGVIAILFAASGCQTAWELESIEAPALNECRNFGTDELVIKQEAKLMMYGYTNSRIPRLSFGAVQPLLPEGGGISQLTVEIHYDSVRQRSEVDVTSFPGNPLIRGYLDVLEDAWENNLQFTDFVRDVVFRVKITPAGNLEIQYSELSLDRASNPERTCYTIPLTRREAGYLVPLKFPISRISMVFNRMPAEDAVRAYQETRSVFISKFTGVGQLVRGNR